MTNNKWQLLWVALAIVLFIAATNGIYTINTVDYYRVVNTFIDVSTKPFKPFDANLSLSSPMKLKFDSVIYAPYASSFTYIVYWYADAISKFTNIFSIEKLSWLWKGLFILSVYYLSSCLNWKGWKRVAILFALTLLLSSTSNLAFFESLYQELVCLFCLPAMTGYMIKDRRGAFDHLLFVVCVLVMSCAKSQFFYIPALFSILIALFLNGKAKWVVILMCAFIQVLSIMCITLSSSATNYNKYHAAYLGSYAMAESNGIDLAGINYDCIGVDAWGNKVDLKDGAIPTKLGRSCYEMNKDITFKDSLKVYLANPSLILRIPFDDRFLDQFRYNYFHVYKRYALAHGGGWFSDGIDKVKDSVWNELKVILPFIILLISVFIKDRRLITGVLTLNAIFYSQIYISFLGEGFRDLSKHLFLSNFSLDLMLLTLVSFLLLKSIK